MGKMEHGPSGASEGARRATGEAPEGRAARFANPHPSFAPPNGPRATAGRSALVSALLCALCAFALPQAWWASVSRRGRCLLPLPSLPHSAFCTRKCRSLRSLRLCPPSGLAGEREPPYRCRSSGTQVLRHSGTPLPRLPSYRTLRDVSSTPHSALVSAFLCVLCALCGEIRPCDSDSGPISDRACPSFT
jgi:hypothetical protein